MLLLFAGESNRNTKVNVPGVEAVGVVEAEDWELDALEEPMTMVSPPDPLPGRPTLPVSLGVEGPPAGVPAEKSDFCELRDSLGEMLRRSGEALAGAASSPTSSMGEGESEGRRPAGTSPFSPVGIFSSSSSILGPTPKPNLNNFLLLSRLRTRENPFNL